MKKAEVVWQSAQTRQIQQHSEVFSIFSYFKGSPLQSLANTDVNTYYNYTCNDVFK